jgi:hypothetical protein
MTPLTTYIDVVDSVLGLIARWLRLRLGIRIGPFVVEFKGVAKAGYQETLQKISTAQSHLAQAVESIDSIKSEFTAEKSRLDTLLKEIQAKKLEYERAASELETARDLLGKDKAQLRSALGLDERRGRVSGFVAGVLASLLASVIWAKGPEAWAAIVSLWAKVFR